MFEALIQRLKTGRLWIYLLFGGSTLVSAMLIPYIRIALKARKSKDLIPIFRQFRTLPMGNRFFSFCIGIMSPYSGTISPRVQQLEYDRVRVEITQRWGIQNPFASIHAMALGNLAELTASLIVMSNVAKSGMRAIPIGIRAQYTKKSRGTVTAVCENVKTPTKEQIGADGEFEQLCNVVDSKGDITAKFWVNFSVRPEENAKK